MLARVATFEFADAGRSVAALAVVRDAARERVAAIPGWRGVLQLVDVASGRATVIHLLDDAESLAAAEIAFEGLSRHLSGEAADALAELRAARRSVSVLDVRALELDGPAG